MKENLIQNCFIVVAVGGFGYQNELKLSVTGSSYLLEWVIFTLCNMSAIEVNVTSRTKMPNV